MKCDRLGFDLSVLDVDFVTAQHNRYVLAHSDQIFVPRRHVFVCDARGHVEHDDGALALNIVAISKTAELLLASRIPHVEGNWATVCRESERMNLNAKSCLRKEILIIFKIVLDFSNILIDFK